MDIFRRIFSRRYAYSKIDTSGYMVPISEEQRNQIQAVLLEMYVDILHVCEKYNLVPFLAGGCALGAVRHGGFIPWDDDLDIAMLREHYDILLNVIETEYPDKYIVNAPEKSEKPKERFAKIMKKGTLFKEIVTVPDEDLNGIFVDVFPLENIPDNDIVKTVKGIRCNMAEFIGSQVFLRENATPESKSLLKATGGASYAVRTAVGIIFGVKKSKWWYQHINKLGQYRNNATKRCASVYGRKHYFGEILNRTQIMPPRYVDFCGIKAPVFNDLEGYLTLMYGDYMKIPPVEKREVHMIRELQF